MDKVKGEILIMGYLIDEVAKLRHGWGRRARARKKLFRRQLCEGWRVLRNLGVLGSHRKRCRAVAEWDKLVKEKANGNA